MKHKKVVEVESMYCPKCGGCGYVGCCGIQQFLETHVRGKTDCTEEAGFIQEIIDAVRDY